MGGCHCSAAKEPTGLVLPEQEIAIADLETLHPFGRTAFSACFQTFIQSPEQVADYEFFAMLHSLGISTDQFSSKASRFTLYHYELKRATGQVTAKQLLLSLILLSNTAWPEKLAAFCQVCALDPQRIMQTELKAALEALAAVAAKIHPAMAAAGTAVSSVRYYSSRITHLVPAMLSTVLAALCPRQSTSLPALRKAFEAHPGLQKLFWGSGLRVLLLEEEVKVQSGSRRASPRSCFQNKRSDNGASTPHHANPVFFS